MMRADPAGLTFDGHRLYRDLAYPHTDVASQLPSGVEIGALPGGAPSTPPRAENP
jgi:hypothetical protein